jgi:RNA polymerase sigma-70 factor (ECF subfamily)
MSAPSDAVAAIFRAEAGPLVGSLVRILGDFDLAEDAVQDAIVEALRVWPESGVPPHPSAWLRVTARNRAIDRLRREARGRDKLQLLGRLEAAGEEAEPVRVVDDRLALIFTCCHPALSQEAQVALTLRSVLGLTTAQLARAFLTSEATMTKRIVRAKRRLVESGVAFRVPAGDDLNMRLGEVLAAVYLMFNEGYLSTGPDAPERRELAADAEWLSGLLLQLLPEEPEVIGLAALIRLNQARRDARFDAAGRLVLLSEQDRSRWDRAGIDAAIALLNRALRRGRPGAYQVQAAIAVCHARARRWEDTDWARIVALYDTLCAFAPSPIVSLNRAIALEHTLGPAAALAALEPISGSLAGYHLYHATRAHLLRAVGRLDEAAAADRTAASLTRNPAELSLLEQRAGLFPP